LAGKEVTLSAGYFTEESLLTQSFFIAENLTDIKFVSLLIEVALDLAAYPATYLKFRPVGGGGSTVRDSISAEAAVPLRGLVMCDRDKCGPIPPLKDNSTSKSAFSRARELGLVDAGVGLSTRNPFFGFLVTWGFSAENFVGPHLLDAYFDTVSRAERARFTLVFPDFPRLNDAELEVWRLLNLKRGTPVMTEVLGALKDTFGAVPAYLLPRFKHATKLSVPRDVISWSIDNKAATRWSRLVRQAIASDLKLARYRGGVWELTERMRTLLAGDQAAARV
jgi:hypothetical protein